MKNALALVLALWPLNALCATPAPDCAAPAVVAAPIDGPLQPMQRVMDYRVVLQDCRSGDGRKTIAIRAMRVEDEDLRLAVDTQTLDTRLERANCWTCSDTTAQAQAQTRFIHAVDFYASQSGKNFGPRAAWLDNAGLTSGRNTGGRGAGVFVTGDLCPSNRPLDRAFLQSLERQGASTPIALSITGVWLERHAEDFAWLRREKAEGRLAIAFVDHSYHHPYRPGLPDAENFLLVAGLDRQAEILDVEKLLIANGETPSVFFRFPGLVSDRAWMELLRRDHLIPLGSDAWLALPQNAEPGAVVLVHPNGNEPFGLSRFEHLREKGALPRPFRPISEAP